MDKKKLKGKMYTELQKTREEVKHSWCSNVYGGSYQVKTTKIV
jgi:hypothetical protein